MTEEINKNYIINYYRGDDEISEDLIDDPSEITIKIEEELENKSRKDSIVINKNFTVVTNEIYIKCTCKQLIEKIFGHKELIIIGFSETLNNIPYTVTDLKLSLPRFNDNNRNYNFIKHVEIIEKQIKNLQKIQRLTIRYCKNLKIDKLPQILKYIKIMNVNVHKPTDKYTTIQCKIYYLPQSLEELCTENINECSDNLPQQLKYLNFGDKYNKSINKLPLNLLHLSIKRDFNKKVHINKLPKFLTKIEFYDSKYAHLNM